VNILNVNSSLELELGGGTAERTFQMSRFLAKQLGVECVVLTLNICINTARTQSLLPARSFVLPCIWQRYYLPRAGWRMINRLVADANVIHLMGHWSALNYFVYLAARRAGKPYVVCPAGALPIFGRSAFLKLLYNFIAGHAIMKNAAGWVAVTASELPDFERYKIDPTKVVIIPNGVNENEFLAENRHAFLLKHKLPDAPIILFMGRLNPIKGPDLLLQAFIQVCDQLAKFHLVFVGPDGGMLKQLQMLVKQAEIESRVHFLGYLSGEEKSMAYHAASLLVVPSRQEAMSIVAIEAGICGVPILLTEQCGFSKIKEIDPRLEVSATVGGIALGLTQLLVDPNVLLQIAPKLLAFIRQHFTWDKIGSAYIELYKNIDKNLGK
jgi:glycosyltransferase involved in cell wall biosynthesis